MKGDFARRCLIAIHSALMWLYPGSFRVGFGDEVQGVFSQALQEADGQGVEALGMFFLRELRDLPVAALREWVQEWRGLDGEAGQSERLSRKEMLVALAVFLIPAGLILLNSAPPVLVSQLIPPVILGLLIVGIVTGLVRRFPRWSLPYFGLIFSAVVFLYLFQWEAERIATYMAARFVVQPADELGRLLLVMFWRGVVWLSLLVLVSFCILILKALPRFQAKVQRMGEDWTRLSYFLYGGSMLTLVLAFEEYRFEEPFALTALLCLAVGAWNYLNSSSPRRRFLALFMGVTLSMWVAALGKWLLVPQQGWTAWFHWHSPESERWFEAQQLLVNWMWIVVVMALPSLAKWVSHPRSSTM